MDSDTKALQINEDELTLKQSRWLKAYIETGNATLASKLAGYQCSSENAFSQIGSENLRKLQTSELLEQMGLTKRSLLQVLKINIAKSTRKVQKKITTWQEEPVTGEFKLVKNKRGQLVVLGTKDVTEFEYEEVPDYEERRKSTEIALKLHGELRTGNQGQNNQFNLGEGSTIQIVNYAGKQEEIKADGK